MKFTLVCDWAGFTQQLLDDRFVIVVEAENYKEATERAAHIALNHYTFLQETETPNSFWDGENGGVILVAHYGDVSGTILDLTTYDVLNG
ncbi:hypothetical protein [Streptomyces sp. NPDC056987]|uniref:hypothetical protein n=1 Tax=Streptomyces sp. NPDC056987 TaxID=3345988 RepID=UPI003644EE2B